MHRLSIAFAFSAFALAAGCNAVPDSDASGQALDVSELNKYKDKILTPPAPPPTSGVPSKSFGNLPVPDICSIDIPPAIDLTTWDQHTSLWGLTQSGVVVQVTMIDGEVQPGVEDGPTPGENGFVGIDPVLHRFVWSAYGPASYRAALDAMDSSCHPNPTQLGTWYNLDAQAEAEIPKKGTAMSGITKDRLCVAKNQILWRANQLLQECHF
jgi:hypothetical protein